MPSTLIFGTSWVPDQQAKWLLAQWVSVTRKLNPDTDMLLIDSASPAFAVADDSVRVVSFPDNIGALARGGRDGWGRAFTKGVELAVAGGYDWAAFIECDLLLARPVAPIIERLAAHRIGAACPMANPYAMIETALTFMDVRYMKKIDFIARYGWETAPPIPLCEFRVEQILGDRFFALPLKGLRNDLQSLTPRNIRQMFPAGCDYLTHATPAVFRAMMEMNGLQEA